MLITEQRIVQLELFVSNLLPEVTVGSQMFVRAILQHLLCLSVEHPLVPVVHGLPGVSTHSCFFSRLTLLNLPPFLPEIG